MSSAPVIILGAGPTGLSAAYHLGEKALLLERETRVGGGCRSLCAGGFTFDMAGHVMVSNDPYVHELYALLLGANVHWQELEACVHSQGLHTRDPLPPGAPPMGSRARFGYPRRGGFQALMDGFLPHLAGP